VRQRAALILLFLAPAAAHATRGRLDLSLAIGGGYVSDVFVGAGLGRDGFAQVAPACRLDLSLAPAWKLAAMADVAYGHYLSSEYTSLLGTFGVESRWLARDDFDLTLSLGGDHGSYSQGTPLDPALVTSPTVSEVSAARGSLVARLRLHGLEWRAAALAGARRSTSSFADAEVPEDQVAVLAGFMRPLGRSAFVAVTYKLARTASSDPLFTFTSHALFGLASLRVADVRLTAQLQAQTSALGNGVRENLGVVTTSARYPLLDTVDVEAVYSWSASRTTDPERRWAARHLAFVGLRWLFAELTW
jgi:hypothetical protein